MGGHPLARWKVQLTPALESKVEEFELYGYEGVTIDEIWACLEKKKWRKKVDPEKPLHEIVADIFSLSVGEYMSYMTLEAFKSPDLTPGNNSLNITGL